LQPAPTSAAGRAADRHPLGTQCCTERPTEEPDAGKPHVRFCKEPQPVYWSAEVYLMIWAPLAVAVTLAANPDLERAGSLIEDLRYSEAQLALEAALKRSGNDKKTLVRILELTGVVSGTLKESAKAVHAFEELLMLDPEHILGGDQPPRVIDP